MQKFGINPERISLKNQKLPKAENDASVGRRLSQESTKSKKKESSANNIVQQIGARPVSRTVAPRKEASGLPAPAKRAEINEEAVNGRDSRSRKPHKKQKKMYKKKYIYSDTYREFYGPAVVPLFFRPSSSTCRADFTITPRNSPHGSVIKHSDVPVDLSNNIYNTRGQHGVQRVDLSRADDSDETRIQTAFFSQKKPECTNQVNPVAEEHKIIQEKILDKQKNPLAKEPKIVQEKILDDQNPLAEEPQIVFEKIVDKQKNPLAKEPQIVQEKILDKQNKTDYVDTRDVKQKNKKKKCSNSTNTNTTNTNNSFIFVVMIILFLLFFVFYLLSRTG